MVVKVEAEPAEVTASDSLNINLTVSPPATNIYTFYFIFVNCSVQQGFQEQNIDASVYINMYEISQNEPK